MNLRPLDRQASQLLDPTPIAAEDVAAAVGRAAAGEPVNGSIEVAGPETFLIEDFVRRTFAASGDHRPVVPSSESTYFGATIEERTLLPLDGAQTSTTTLIEWLATNTQQ